VSYIHFIAGSLLISRVHGYVVMFVGERVCVLHSLHLYSFHLCNRI